MENRQLTYAEAIREALDLAMEKDKSVYLMGLGVGDPKRIFGTTASLIEKYGKDRVFEMPVAENAMTGVAIGSTLIGMRPVLSHQRMDFAFMSMDQIANNVAKWQYMFGGAFKLPLTIRMIIGRGWGQGPQHSQNLQALFMHIPGLKVVMPFSPQDAKGMLISSIEENNPVIFIEHRWLHNIKGYVPEEYYSIPIGKAKIINEGKDITIITCAYMALEVSRAVKILEKFGVSVEVLDLRTIKPLDKESILKSVKKTGKVIVVDSGYLTGGLASEISAIAVENAFEYLKAPIRRITLPDCPAPTTRALIKYYYPKAKNIVKTVLEMLQIDEDEKLENILKKYEELMCDVPDKYFTGPY